MAEDVIPHEDKQNPAPHNRAERPPEPSPPHTFEAADLRAWPVSSGPNSVPEPIPPQPRSRSHSHPLPEKGEEHGRYQRPGGAGSSD